MKKVGIIGAGLGGLSAASLLAKDGYDVTIYEKNSIPGGRAIVHEEKGFRFDMGPSWYLMPDAFDLFFAEFGKKTSDYYKLIKLDPSYKVFFSSSESITVRPNIEHMAEIFDAMEKGAGTVFKNHMRDMKYKYELGVPKYILKDYSSLSDLFDIGVLPNLFKLELLETYHHSIAKKFKDSRIQKILEFMVVFLGGSPYKVPGLYNLINWADFGLHVYYPEKGFFEVSKGFEKLAKEQGAKVQYQSSVSQVVVKNGLATGLIVNGVHVDTDIVIANTDYPFVEQSLLDRKYQTYSDGFWRKAELAPSGICILLGIRGRVSNLEHHTLVFNDQWEKHFRSIEQSKEPIRPQYYVSTPSKTDPSVAPEGAENIFILIPVSTGLKDTPDMRQRLYDYVLSDLEQKTGYSIRNNIMYKHIYGLQDFTHMYNAYKGNAFGLGHTLKHSLLFRPKNVSQKVRNLYFTGQFTNPGTGTPLVVLSGLVVRNLIRKRHAKA